MEKARIAFTEEMDAGNYRRAMELLLFIASHYETHGCPSVEERDGFEIMAKWFDEYVYEKVLVPSH